MFVHGDVGGWGRSGSGAVSQRGGVKRDLVIRIGIVGAGRGEWRGWGRVGLAWDGLSGFGDTWGIERVRGLRDSPRGYGRGEHLGSLRPRQKGGEAQQVIGREKPDFENGVKERAVARE